VFARGIESFSCSGSNDRVGFQGIDGATDSRIEDGEKFGAVQKFGESTTNVATGSNSNKDKKNIIASTLTVDYINNIKFKDEEESSDFDFESSSLI
jgi:hypothetical protein